MKKTIPYSPQVSAALWLMRRLEAGFVVAPRDPSVDMVAAGAQAAKVAPEVAAEIYQAMIGRL